MELLGFAHTQGEQISQGQEHQGRRTLGSVSEAVDYITNQNVDLSHPW
jgi:hypothetical protein